LLTHETSGIGRVGAHFSINFDKALVDNCNNLAPGQSILEPVSEKNRKRKGFAELMRTGGWAGSLWPIYELQRSMKWLKFLT